MNKETFSFQLENNILIYYHPIQDSNILRILVNEKLVNYKLLFSATNCDFLLHEIVQK